MGGAHGTYVSNSDKNYNFESELLIRRNLSAEKCVLPCRTAMNVGVCIQRSFFHGLIDIVHRLLFSLGFNYYIPKLEWNHDVQLK